MPDFFRSQNLMRVQPCRGWTNAGRTVDTIVPDGFELANDGAAHMV